LTELNVLRLRFRDLQRGFQLRRLRHFHQHRPLRHLLPHVHIQFLQHSANAGSHL
jgi:hypothetical protein